MFQQSATCTFDCSDCGGVATYDLVGVLIGTRLHWDASVRCSSCPQAVEVNHGSTVCVDDDALLREQGGWFGLHVGVPDGDRVRLVKELRSALKLPMSEAGRMLADLPGVLAHGLELEMRRVEALVLRAVPHAVTSVVRVGD